MVNGVSCVGITDPEVFILAGVGAEVESMDQVLSIPEWKAYSAFRRVTV
jgi:hypothetical protein